MTTHRTLANWSIALVPRAALVLLYSRALGGVAGMVVSLATLVLASAAGALLERTRLRGWAAIALAAVGYWALRAILLGAIGALVAAGGRPSLARLLQSIDAASLALAPVVAYGAIASFVAARRPRLVRWEPLAHAILLLALLWSQANYSLTYFERPWAYVLVVGVLLAADVVLLIDPRHRDRRSVGRSALLVAPLVALALLLSVGWYSSGGAEAGGGILRPTLFRFDFAPFVQLESEITMSDDLVLLYRRSGRPRRELIRRYVLTDYDPRRGFSVGEAEVVIGLDDPSAYRGRQRVRQEYFLVNLDPGTRLALNEPTGYVTYEEWDASSFTAAFAAESAVSRAPAFELARADAPELTPEQRAVLTDYGGNESIRELAVEITDGIDGAFARARAIELYLQENYYYSLRPGIAADGDQLMHFLFESRKGYCSYYAFSMALMVRSLGIPARVAVGFFVDPNQEVLNFYPVLANMAHAWVEVYLTGYGWIPFDPTSQTLAPGEEYEFGAGADPDELTGLLEEILAQELIAAQEREESVEEAEQRTALPPFLRSALARWYVIVALLLAVYLAAIRLAPLAGALSGDHRTGARATARFVLAWARACGLEQRDESLRDFARRVQVDGLAELLEAYERALYAPLFGSEDRDRTRIAAARALRGIRRAVPVWRRALAVVDPRPHLRVRERVA